MYIRCFWVKSSPTRAHWATLPHNEALNPYKTQNGVEEEEATSRWLIFKNLAEAERQQQISNGIAACGSFTTNSTISHFFFSISNSGHPPQPQLLTYTPFFSLFFNPLRSVSTNHFDPLYFSFNFLIFVPISVIFVLF